MKKAKSLLIVNTLLIIFGLFQAASGMLMEMEIYLPIFRVHGLTGAILTVLAILHVILNWGWIKANYFGGSRKASKE